MKLAVCLKRIPAPDGNIRISANGRAFDLTLVDPVVNPSDEYALEAALRIRSGDPSSRLLALVVGAREQEAVLRTALAVGADDGWLVEAPGVDASRASELAASVLRDFGPDLIFCGNRAVDDGQGFFPAALAEMLGFVHVSGICAIEVSSDGGRAICQRRVETGEQRVEASLPAVVACERMSHELRTPLLKARLDSKKRPLAILQPAAPGIATPGPIPFSSPRLLLDPPERSPKRLLTTGPGWTADAFLKDLRDAEGLGR